MSFSKLNVFIRHVPMLNYSQLMSSLFLYSFIEFCLLRRLPCLLSRYRMISSSVCDRFSSLFGEWGVVWVMNVSDCLSVLRKCVSRRKDSLRNVFLIIIHFLMIILSVLLLISLISKHSVVIMKPSTGGFRQINARFRICL